MSGDEVGRRHLLTTAGLASAALIAAPALDLVGTAEAAISSRKSRANDRRILNFVLAIEYLQSALYAQVIERGTAGNALFERFARTAGAQQQAHVLALQIQLGRSAMRQPSLQLGEAVTTPAAFAQAAQSLEDVAVSAYSAQIQRAFRGRTINGLVSMVTVEARHAAWIRFLNLGGGLGRPDGQTPSPLAFDLRLTERNVRGGIRDLGFDLPT